MNEVDILEQQAVDAAINLQWEQAADLNLQILKVDPKNEAAHLRLGFIYLQLNDIAQAKKYYSKALKIQPRNTVAIQNLERISILENEKVKTTKKHHISFDPDLFMDTAGKTKTVFLSNLGQKNILARLTIGQLVELQIKKRKVEVRTTNHEYIGTLPDDLSKRLTVFLEAKSTYVTYIKEATLTRVTVFIKEETKGKAVRHEVSFPQNIQRKMQELPGTGVDEKEDEPSDEHEEPEHVDAWEKMVADGPVADDKELMIDLQRDDLEDEE